jgi:hypothetical protein
MFLLELSNAFSPSRIYPLIHNPLDIVGIKINNPPKQVP